MEKTAGSVEAFLEESRQFALRLRVKPQEATLITLSGELGAGKTTFVQAVAKALGVTEHITSPTFVIMKSYTLAPAEAQGFSRLVHVDAYRLRNGAELAPVRLADHFTDPGTLIMLEWPENVEDVLPAADVAITLVVGRDERRTIRYA